MILSLIWHVKCGDHVNRDKCRFETAGNGSECIHVAVRQLSALYLTAASAFGLAIVLSHHPVQGDRDAEDFVRTVSEAFSPPPTPAEVDLPIAPFNPPARPLAPKASPDFPRLRIATPQGVPPSDASDLDLRLTGNTSFPAHRHSHSARRASKPVDSALADSRSAVPDPSVAADRDDAPVAAGRAPSAPELAARAAQPPLDMAPDSATASPPPVAAIQPLTSIPPGPGPSTGEIALVERRLTESLTPEIAKNFGLFLYVSKAASGPVAQHMYVFEKQRSGQLSFAYDWPVSTGREKAEYNPAGRLMQSFTPAGYFELDPHRFYTHYMSHQWNEPMPYAMFFNWIRDGEKTGLAIHSASGADIALLGNRASAGCIRLPPDAARTLFELIRTQYRGLVPRFAIDRRTGTMSRDGIVLHDPDGRVRLSEGYKVLVLIEDFGGQNVVAAIY
jgi:lipoprotein-anchoring transpeptidase ErfK/SrfK